MVGDVRITPAMLWTTAIIVVIVVLLFVGFRQ
jgi:hypothetical protein